MAAMRLFWSGCLRKRGARLCDAAAASRLQSTQTKCGETHKVSRPETSFTKNLMDIGTRRIFSEEHDIFRQSVRRFFEAEVVPYHTQWEKDGQVSREIWEKAGQQGLLGVNTPEEHGGIGGDILSAAIVWEEQMYVNCSGPGFSLHSDIVVPYITHYGSKDQIERYIPQMVSGKCIGAIAMTEPGAGSDLQGVRTNAKKDGSDWILNGSKVFITNGWMSDVVLVVAVTDHEARSRAHGLSLFLVNNGMKGFIKGKKLEKIGLKAQDTAELFFEDVRLPADALLGEVNKGFYYLMSELPQERLLIAAMALANCEFMFEETRKYVKQRKAFGKTIADLQTVQHKLAEIKTQACVGRAFIDSCLQLHMERRLDSATASMAKYWASELQNNVANQCVQLHGGWGYMWEYPIAKGSIFIAVGLLGQRCMATMAPALTETATEGHGFQLSSSSLPSSTIEPDTFMHKEDAVTEQKLNGDCDMQSTWSQLAYPFAAHGLGSDATNLKHVAYGSAIVHSSNSDNTALLTSTNSLLDILSLNCNLTSRKKLFNKNSPVVLTKKNLSCDITEQTSAHASRMYGVSEAELSSNKNGMKGLSCQKNSPLKCTGVLTAASEMKLACDSVSVNFNAPGSITSNQKAELKTTKANRTWDTVPAVDAIQIGNLLSSTRQSAQQRKQEKELCNSKSTRETQMNTQLLECHGRQQELAKKASRLGKRLQIIQAKHVEHHVKYKIQELIKSQQQRQKGISKFDSSKAKSVFLAGIKYGDGEQTGSVPNPINSELFEYTCFSKALLSHIEGNVDSDATGSSADEDSESEEISLKRNVPVKYSSEWRWTIDRAEIASRWTWLQAQISELEYRIRQLNDIYRHIRAAKEMVILDDSQPSKNILKKRMQLTEATALLAATEDNKTPAEIKDSTPECNLEMSPSSPSLLLRNIDKQSAQLTESVNSLIPPLNLSPASSPVSCKACSHLDGIVCSVLGGDQSSCSTEPELFECQSKKKHLDRTSQRLLSMGDTSARTRPLWTQHKHRLFSCVYNANRQIQQAAAVQCKCCWLVSCEMCGPDNTTDAVDSRTMTLEEKVAMLDPCFHPVLSLHCDMPLNVHIQASLHNEEWNKQPFPSIMNELKASLSNNTPCKSHTCEDTLDSIRCDLNKHHYAKALGQHWNQSPSVPKLQTPAEASRKPLKELRKRRHSNERTTVLNKRHCALLNSCESPSGSSVKTTQTPVPIQQTPCSSPTDSWAPRSTPPQRPLTQTKDIPLRQRQQSECCYDIDNIVIPMSLVATSKIEKLQYKEIITPSWRIVAIKTLKDRHIQGKVDQDTSFCWPLCLPCSQLEDTSDEAFALRHKKHERREQARWFLWEQSRCHRRGSRSSSFSKNNDEHLNPHLPAPPDNENQLDFYSSVCCVSEMAKSEDTQDLPLEDMASAKVVLPWNCRIFPLSDEEIKCLTHPEVVVADKGCPRPLTRSYSALSENSLAQNQSPCGTVSSSERVPSTGQINAEETECSLSLRGQNSGKK